MWIISTGSSVARKLHNSISFVWDGNSMKISKNFAYQSKILRLKEFFLFSTIFIVFIQAAERSAENQLDWFQHFLLGLQTNMWCCCWQFAHTLIKKAPSLCLYINGLIQYQESLPENLHSKRSVTELLNLNFAYTSIGTFYGFPFLYVYGLHWNNPCSPIVAGYGLIPECNKVLNDEKNYLVNTSLKLTVLGYNHWVWSFGLSAALVGISYIQLLTTMALNDCIRRYR